LKNSTIQTETAYTLQAEKRKQMVFIPTGGQQQYAQEYQTCHSQQLHVWSHSCTLSWLCPTSIYNKQLPVHCTFTTSKCTV